MKWDVFISYAHEDKDQLVRPLVQKLRDNKLRVWFDEFTLRPGDRLRESIDKGLGASLYGVIILSNSYIKKNWTRYELDGLIHRFVARNTTLIPIWHGLSYDDVVNFSPPLADVVSLDSRKGIDFLLERLLQVIEPQQETVHQELGVLREVFRGNTAREFDTQLTWKGILERFIENNPVLLLKEDPPYETLIDEESEGDYYADEEGLLIYTFRVTDQLNNELFILKFQKQWVVTTGKPIGENESGEWIEYPYASEVIVQAQMPRMEELVDLVLEHTTSH